MRIVDTLPRVMSLRRYMVARKIDVYIIPSEDSHSSEYVAEADARRHYMTGFSGSAGCAVVTLDKAALATDGRYFNQAAQQLGDHWTLLKQGVTDVPTWQEWAAEAASDGKTVAVDPMLLSVSAVKPLADKIRRAGGARLLPLEENLIDLVWGSDRPYRPSNLVKVLDVKFAGKDVKSKLKQVAEVLTQKKASALVLSALDDIAWLFNLRGDDIEFNPVFYSYALVTLNSATLYIHQEKLDEHCRLYLASSNVSVKPYDTVFEDLKRLSREAIPEHTGGLKARIPYKTFLLPKTSSWALKIALGHDDLTDEVRSPVGDLKAIKNDIELAGVRACHQRDGSALIAFYAWLEDEVVRQNNTRINEADAADKLESFRAKLPNYVGRSFSTISASGANASVIHYNPEPNACAIIDPKKIFLCDSGAQYLDGTTDTTRTMHFGTPSEAEIRAYTLVLKGNIALDSAIFPTGTTGFALDCLARQYLRREGLDYRHGTGHGVGCYLSVHEFPVGFGIALAYAEVPLSPGHVLSNEPGYYEDGSFGIRIENVVIVTQAKTRHTFGNEPFLGLEHVTMVPYCQSLIDASMLNEEEKEWLNCYHALIFKNMQPIFQHDPLVLNWLTRETKTV